MLLYYYGVHVMQELETAEPSALTCSDIGEKVAARRKADVATTVKSVSSDLYRVSRCLCLTALVCCHVYAWWQ